MWAIDAPARSADLDELPEAVYDWVIVLVQDGRGIVCGQDLLGVLKRLLFICSRRCPDKRGEVGQHRGPARGRGSQAPEDVGIWVKIQVKGEITQQGAGMESEPWESQAPRVRVLCAGASAARQKP